MNRFPRGAALALLLALPLQACSKAAAAPTPAPPQAAGQARPGGAPAGAPARANQAGPKSYAEVVTEKAVTQDGMFKVHRVDDKVYFEIPGAQLGKEMLLIGRPVSSTLQDPGGFFGGGARLYVQWERDGNRVVLREKEHDLTAKPDEAVWRAVSPFRLGPVLASFDAQAFGPDSAAVVDVSELFISNIPELNPVESINRQRSWVDGTWSFPNRVNVRVTQSGQSRPAATPGAPAGPGAAQRPPQSQTMEVFFSMMRLPDEPMMPRFEDDRVGYISSSTWDFSRPDNRLDRVSYIHRFKLEKKNPGAAVSDPVEPIVYWIDPATPDWLKPWIVSGVNAWQEAFETAGFSNAIFGRVAPTPEEDPDFSLFDAGTSAIYWRPSTVANATGGQTVDPRSGQILKGEVNMYHNIMQLQKQWYFIQVGPLDARAENLPLPDSLMGRLVEYVVTHEIGHSIGFPHNMKSSAMYPADSLRSRSFLERMNGHVATLMDYSRFNYVAQPEDGIPPDLLIPKIGPYDHFAVKWGYAPIPGARTPDAERATLDQWARQQDTVPWFRFTTADAGSSDPENNTEAVGDADAVKSTRYGMLNLGRVMDMMIRVTEQPGDDYSELEDMYGQAIGQWGRYMGHVAAIVGGAYTQEKYGTGERFRPMERARQREAVRYLNDVAFRIPAMFMKPEVLRRIEPDGQLARFRTQQQRVLNSLLSQNRLERLVEFEAMAARAADAYTLADLMSDLRAGVWDELDDATVRVDPYRRNLHRAYLEAMDRRLHPTEAELNRPATPFSPAMTPPWGSDVRAVMRAELRDLDGAIQQAQGRAGDAMTRTHLRDLRMEIERILSTER